MVVQISSCDSRGDRSSAASNRRNNNSVKSTTILSKVRDKVTVSEQNDDGSSESDKSDYNITPIISKFGKNRPRLPAISSKGLINQFKT